MSQSAEAVRVTVVIPTFNRCADVRRALGVLREQAGPPLAVIVVDNSSTDDTGVMVAGEQPAWEGRLRYVRKAPQGPASARNLGLGMACTPYVLFHDSDIELASDWALRAVAQLDGDPSLGAVGGYIVYAFDPGRVNAYGGDLGWFGLAWDVDEGKPLRPGTAAADRVWINCSAMLVRRAAAVQAGAFDETFFYGFEDTDLGWRMCITGHRVRVVPELVARHNVDPSPGQAHPEIVFHYCKNRLRMLLRNTQGHRLPWALGAYLAYTLVDVLLRAPRLPKLRALAWNLAHWRATGSLRRSMQAQRATSDRQILALGEGRAFPPTRLGGQRRRGTEGGAVPARERVGADDRV
ncbi:MAG: glycosyltransferase family 2 protein [Comamonadaceae bacterium]|nr:MAG: glycosyltransferase family 2 protein [Comamonadaceae bacterium]